MRIKFKFHNYKWQGNFIEAMQKRQNEFLKQKYCIFHKLRNIFHIKLYFLCMYCFNIQEKKYICQYNKINNKEEEETVCIKCGDIIRPGKQLDEIGSWKATKSVNNSLNTLISYPKNLIYLPQLKVCKRIKKLIKQNLLIINVGQN